MPTALMNSDAFPSPVGHVWCRCLVLFSTFCALPAIATSGTCSRLEVSFHVPELKGNPFDYTANNLEVTFKRPDGQLVIVPAFFDGGDLWRARFTPHLTGAFEVQSIRLNGKAAHEEKLSARRFVISDLPFPGFIRVDRDRQGFVFDNGQKFYPFGCNAAWSSRHLDVPAYLTKFGAAGVNWSRIWMTHFDERNLEWSRKSAVKLGELSLEAAHRWDAIVETAEREGIYFQMVLQHHGQYSTRTDSNWATHPWNVKNGGWLESAEQFFTDPQARALTKAKYRYILARWGYSPAVLAWELFNEVQYVDAFKNDPAAVTRWHAEMAEFLRQHDSQHHLITTSSDLSADIWQSMDYYQAHTYPCDALTGVRALAGRVRDKPFFIAEMGPAIMGSIGLDADDGSFLHQFIWAGLMNPMAGAAQAWEWGNVEQNDLYFHFKSAAAFLKASAFARALPMGTADVKIETVARGPLRFAPVAGWRPDTGGKATVHPDGSVLGLENMQTFLHGSIHRDLPTNFTFNVDYPKPGSFKAVISASSERGAQVSLSLDGKEVGASDFAPAAKPVRTNVVLQAAVKPGKHVITLCNRGADWVIVDRIELSPYAPVLGCLGRSNGDYAALWIYRRADGTNALSGTLELRGMNAGDYLATWWDIESAKPQGTSPVHINAREPLRLATPLVTRDVAVWISRVTK